MQEIIYGFNKETLCDLLKKNGVTKYILVCDGALEFLPIKDEFEKMGIPFVKFSEFSPNPVYEDVAKGVKLFCDEGCDGLVAVGGGSSIDVAKCIKLYSKMDHTKCYVGQPFEDNGYYLCAIPTTAGTGSESTRHAVMYYEGNKQSISHLSIVPDTAILDSSLLLTLPLYQKKCTMLDALGQGIESLWSVNSNDESREYSRKAISLIWENAGEYIFENSPFAAGKITEGANYSGRAINITQTTAAHAMSYKLSSLYKLPHGHAVAICLAKVWKYMLSHTDDCIDPRGKEHLVSVFDEIAEIMGEKDAESAEAAFEELLANLAISGPVAENTEDLEVLADSVNPVRLKNNPVSLDRETMKKMYTDIVKFN